MPHLGLNNNTISAKQEPMAGGSAGGDSSRSPASSPHLRYHTSPASSSMHLEDTQHQGAPHAQHSPTSISPLNKDSSGETAEASADAMPASVRAGVEESEPQAEDLSNKSSRGASPILNPTPPQHSAVASAARNRYHPYCHSEIMIKSE